MTKIHEYALIIDMNNNISNEHDIKYEYARPETILYYIC